MKKIYVLLSAVLLGTGTYAQGDDCATAVPITPGTYTADGPSTGGGAVGSGTTGTNGDWYSFTPTCSGTIDVASCDGGTDTKLYIFDGTAGCGTIGANEISVNDDACQMGPGLSSYASQLNGVNVTAGTTYYIEWTDRWSTSGFDWSLVFNSQSFAGANVSNITNVGADLAWAPIGAETSWDVEYGIAGFLQGSGTSMNVTPSSNTTLTGLQPLTTYDVYITLPGDPCTVSMLSFTTLPLCPEPTAVSATSGALDAQVTWTAGGVETMWDVEYGQTGFVLGAGTTDNVVTTSDNITGLNESTCYHYYVRAVCDLNTIDGVDTTSLWVGPNEFCTVSTCPEPTALTASTTNPNEADLSWTAGLETNWNIEYGPTGFTPGTGTSMTTTTNPTTITGLMSDMDYDYYVQAVCTPGSDSSFWSGPFTFHTIITCPGVSGLTAGNLTTTSADLSWTAGGVETAWNVEWGMSGFTPGTGTVVNVNTTPATSLTGLTPGTNYDYYVQAVCGAGDSATWVGPFTFMTVISCPQPTNLNAINISQTAANLMWQAGGSEADWDVEWGDIGFMPGTGVSLGNATATTSNPYYATGLNSCSSYEFYVKANCGAGDNSTWAGPFVFSTLAGTVTAPYMETFDASTSVPNCWSTTGSEPWSFDASGAFGPGYGVSGAVDHTTGMGNYTWIDGSGGIGSNELVSPSIDYSTVTNAEVGFWILSNNIDDAAQNVVDLEMFDGTNWVTLGSYSGNNPNWVEVKFNIPAGMPMTTQFRLVQVENPGGSGSAYHNDLLVDDFFVRAGQPCTDVAGTAVGGVVCLNPGQPTDLFDAITGYSDGNGTFYYPAAQTGAQTFAGSNGSLVLTGLTENTDYTFDYVVGSGACADTVSFIYNWSTGVNAGGDGAVTSCSYHNVVLIQELMGQVDMGGTWSDVDNAGGLFNGIFDATGIAAGTYNFMYTVSNGTCSDSANVAVTVDECLGVNENENASLEVYPNPVNTTLTIANINVDGNATISLVDMQGKVVYNNTVSNLNGNFQLDMSNFESGIYVVRLTTDKANQEIRVVKQ